MTDTNATNTDWAIEFEFENGESLQIPVESQAMLGRGEAGQSSSPLIDLLPYGADKLGVSRKHASIRWQGPHLYIYDMDSANGTVLNGTRLQANIGYRLNDGDSLHLGHMALKLKLNMEAGHSSIRARRVEFDLQNVPLMGRGQAILIVEDDPSISQLYKSALEASGFVTHTVRDVVGAMRWLAQTTPSLIILDLMLPGVHGLELTRYIQRNTDDVHIPIIVSSALTDSTTIKTAIDAGVDVYLSKPANIKELTRVVGALIFKSERENPGGTTKQLRGTASLEEISSEPRNDTIVIFVEDHREPIGAVVQPLLTFGRNVPGSGKNHVDLEPYGAFDKGVSRIHAQIKHQNAQFVIEDMGSSNGTFVNGYSLKKDEIHSIHSGDEIRLGDLRMRLYLLAETERSMGV